MSTLGCIHVVLVYSNDQQIEIDIEYDVKFAFRSLLDTINIQLQQIETNNNKTGDNYHECTFNQYSFIGLYHSITHSIFEIDLDDIIEDIVGCNSDINGESYIYISNIPFDEIHPKHSEHPKQSNNANIDNDQDIVMLIDDKNDDDIEIEPKTEQKDNNHCTNNNTNNTNNTRPNTPNTNPNEYQEDQKIDEDKITQVMDLPVLILGYLAEKANKHRELVQYIMDSHCHYKMISLIIWFLRITNYWSNSTVQYQFTTRWLAHGFEQNTIDDILPFAENLTTEGALQFISKTQWEPKEMNDIMENDNKTPLYGYDCCAWCGSNRDDFKDNYRYKSKWNDNGKRKYNVKLSNTPLRIVMQALLALINAGIDVRKDMHKNNLISAAKIMGVTKNEFEFLMLGIYQQVAMLQFLTNYL